MSSWLAAIILGIIEGITEFIPVSSTGHLLLAEQFLFLDGKPLHETFFGTEVFNAVIQCGAMLAALPLFSARLATLKRWREPQHFDYFFKMGVAFVITVVGALIMKSKNLELPDTVQPIALALLIGGALFVGVEWWLRGRQSTSEITWTLAVAFGLAQLIAIAFPGASRSGSTILIALILGLGRGPATEFSFLLGVPTLCAAGVKTMYDALKTDEQILWGPLIVATIVASICSVFAVRWLLRYVQSHTFTGFGIYRIAFGIALLLFVREITH
jgi:undecaprenyl-diphosphatase